VLSEALLDGVVGWLVAMVGTATVHRGGDRLLGNAETRALHEALAEALPVVVAHMPEEAQEDLAAADVKVLKPQDGKLVALPSATMLIKNEDAGGHVVGELTAQPGSRGPRRSRARRTG
jgi:hypothetical protein